MGYKERSREFYYDVFFNKVLYNMLNYVPQEGEVFRQLNEKYPGYLFASNLGYLFSLVFTTEKNIRVKIKKPYYNKAGRNRERSQWRYWIRGKNVSQQHLLFETFRPEEYALFEKYKGEYALHHKCGICWFSENQPQLANRLSNLQLVKVSPHIKSFKYQYKDMFKWMKEIESNENSIDKIVYDMDLTKTLGNILKQLNPTDILIIEPGFNGKNRVTISNTRNITEV